MNKSPKIIKLDIEEFDLESGVDAIALVESPAIELPFMYFKSQFESYNDYPQEASENACKVLRWIDEYGRDEVAGMTQTGLARANQLCNREKISEDTIARMAAFARHEKNAEIAEEYKGTPWKDKGYVAWLGWGGTSGVNWAQRKLEQIRKDKQSSDEYNEDNLTDDDVIDLIIEDYFSHNYIEDLPEDRQEAILEKLFEVGESREDLESQGYVIEEVGEEEFAITSKPDLSSLEDYGKFKIRYSYQGPLDAKNRTFCSRMRKANLIYRKEDINKLTVQGENEEFGIYDIFTYKGSYGCRHWWQRLRIFKDEHGDTIEQTEQSEDAATSVNAKPTLNRNPNGEDVATTKDMVTSNFAEANKEKQLIAGPLMVPNKLIYRYDDYNGEYWVYFSEDTIEKIAYKYLEQGYQKEVNYEHSEEEKLKDITLVESWLVDDPSSDKSKSLMGEEYSKGTWFGIMKVRNKEVWDNYVKTGLVRGFSVEGFFADYMINASKHKFYYRTTEGGTEIVIDEKSFVVFILKDGERQVIMPDGEYKLTNGKTLVVVDSKAQEGTFESTN